LCRAAAGAHHLTAAGTRECACWHAACTPHSTSTQHARAKEAAAAAAAAAAPYTHQRLALQPHVGRQAALGQRIHPLGPCCVAMHTCCCCG
jgi:hypothetical protein